MSTDFRQRALHEAGRYGPDPWVFVRELLQNARDAGATRADIQVEVQNGRERVSCRDDGCGMTFEHARRYLFTLYASSKESESNAAGRFGVGFWSILRFSPDRIIIRSCGDDGQPWEVRLDGDLQRATRREVGTLGRGTEIILERAAGDGDLARRVHDAAFQSARYLHQRGNPRKALQTRVNAQPVNAPFSLPAPSVAFQRGAFRGVVGLGPAPRIELFSRGLRVRSAATLQDLLSAKGRHTDRSRVHFPELPSGLAPQAILESEELEVLLSRGDVRDNRALRRLVRRAHQELTRLVNRQLALARPWWVRFFEALRDRVGGVALGFVLGALVTVPIAGWFLRDLPIGEAITARLQRSRAIATGTAPAAGPTSYSDLSAVYRGPQVDVFQPGGTSVDLTYEPASSRYRFAALVVEGLDERGVAQIPTGSLRRYTGASCQRECVDIRLRLDAEGVTRLPVPTGHRIVPGSVRLAGKPLTVAATSADEPVLVLRVRTTGVLTYRTGPAPPPQHPRVGSVPPLPDELDRFARRLRRRPVEDRVAALVQWVSRNVQYANSAEVAALHEEAARSGVSFVDRSLRIGAGDCDVQNGLLTSLLHAARTPAHMVVGYIGTQGQVGPQLHAWVEFYDGRSWRTADASRGSAAVLTAERVDPRDFVPPPVAGAGTSGEAIPPGPELLPHTPRGVVANRSRTVRDLPLAGVTITFFGFGLFLVGLGLLLPHVRTHRAFYLDTDGNISELLKGALQRPEAFRHISALFHSRLVPCLNGRAISLMDAWERAAASSLFRSDGSSSLAQRAMRRHRVVLDDSRPEGRAVAAALGATDLDYWDTLLTRSRTPPLFREINRLLKASGESWRVHAAPNIPELLVTLDVGKRGILPGGVTRVVLVDQRAPWIREQAGGMERTDPTTVFRALDLILDFVDVPEQRRAELLRVPARRAIRHASQKGES